ncbi:DUF4345 domain-containing protein [Roseomonas fluvialis]|uniref:DUF4345 domain-containing protein n=1 Tax=Roseomonas fluvialis TaxID=1750527 RepID=A0ABN6P014_9PROT|nr:DUF4345 domain-containing protein [Roseomonas fluvialis]BDG71468.1 hypothetical protein Rmf_13970 [Roseomonas fluvialis]
MLPIAIRLAALVPIVAGGGGALFGPALLGEAAGPATASHLRYLSGLLLGLGLLAWWCAGALAQRRVVFEALCAMVVLGGTARLVGLLADGAPPWPHLAALGMELVVVPALWVALQARWACAATMPAARMAGDGAHGAGLDAAGSLGQKAERRRGDAAGRERA